MNPYIHVLTTYMEALGRSDYPAITALFAPGGRVRSPFLGEMEAAPFFERLGAASETNVITAIDIFESHSDREHAVAFFQYEWRVKDGTVITFQVMDYFRFAPRTDRIELLDIIYDTHPIRAEHGNKYESPIE
jgi:hypothetical protein